MNNKKIALVCYHGINSEKHIPAIASLQNWLEIHKEYSFFYLSEEQNCLHTPDSAHREWTNDCVLIIAIGGDGTMLSAARLSTGSGIPIMGVNTGRIGFLTDYPPQSICQALDHFISGKANFQKKMMLECRLQNQTEVYSILNEVQIRASAPGDMVDLAVFLDDEFLTEYWADSLLISTPTGSTAYNMSAGGPIIYPDTEALILNPVNPASLSVRPLVIPAHKKITIKDLSGKMQNILADGKIFGPFAAGQSVSIVRSNHSTHFVSSPDFGFVDALKEKLGWNGKPRIMPQLHNRSPQRKMD